MRLQHTYVSGRMYASIYPCAYVCMYAWLYVLYVDDQNQYQHSCVCRFQHIFQHTSPNALQFAHCWVQTPITRRHTIARPIKPQQISTAETSRSTYDAKDIRTPMLIHTFARNQELCLTAPHGTQQARAVHSSMQVCSFACKKRRHYWRKTPKR
jgi:hypothetical protein